MLPGHRRERQVSGARAEIEHGLAAGQLQCLDGAPAPLLVESRAQQMIQEVVSPGNGVEHAGNARGSFAGGVRDWGLGIGIGAAMV